MLLQVGQKVVPIDKRAGFSNGLEDSIEWKMARISNQPFLYVNHIDRNIITCRVIKVGLRSGDFFLAEDLIPFEPEKMNNTQFQFVLKK